MRTFNRVTLLGHLAADPDLKQTENGIAVANFPLATNRLVKGEAGEKKEMADFHRIVAWRGLADVSHKYLRKGDAVLIEGRILNRSFDDKDGNRHFRTEITADTLNIVGLKKDKNGKAQIDFKEIPELSKEAV